MKSTEWNGRYNSLRDIPHVFDIVKGEGRFSSIQACSIIFYTVINTRACIQSALFATDYGSHLLTIHACWVFNKDFCNYSNTVVNKTYSEK